MSSRSSAGIQPVSPERKWRAIVITTLVLAPAFWAILAGWVAAADEGTAGAQPAAAIAFGVAVLPFVFIAGAFLSQHPNAPGAAARAMGLALLVGIPVLAVAGDGVTGLVAGVGAGGTVAMRRDEGESLKARVWAVAFASAYAFVLVRIAGGIALLSAPVFPLTAIGLADHLSVRRAERDAVASTSSG
ncbi:MAG TPA: hypothetical protein VIR58_02080 [Acidimicrobiales bacterium]